jgi:hypothetical protein
MLNRFAFFATDTGCWTRVALIFPTLQPLRTTAINWRTGSLMPLAPRAVRGADVTGIFM